MDSTSAENVHSRCCAHDYDTLPWDPPQNVKTRRRSYFTDLLFTLLILTAVMGVFIVLQSFILCFHHEVMWVLTVFTFLGQGGEWRQESLWNRRSPTVFICPWTLILINNAYFFYTWVVEIFECGYINVIQKKTLLYYIDSYIILSSSSCSILANGRSQAM